MATTTQAHRDTVTAQVRNDRNLTLVDGESYVEYPANRGSILHGVNLGLSPASPRYSEAGEVDPRIRGRVESFDYDSGRGEPVWRERGSRGSTYRCRAANLSPDLTPGHLYRLFSDGGTAMWLIRHNDNDTTHTIISEPGSMMRGGAMTPRPYIGTIPRDYVWLEVLEDATPGTPADAEPAVQADPQFYTGDSETITSRAARNDDGAIVLNPERVVGKPYITWITDGTPYFAVWAGEDKGGFHYWGRQATYFREVIGNDNGFTNWVEVSEEQAEAPTPGPDVMTGLDNLLAREQYEYELLWTTTHRLAREQSWCGSYDDIVQAWPMEIPRRGGDNQGKVMPSWDDWLTTRNTEPEEDAEPEEHSYMVDLVVRADVHWDSAPGGFDQWTTEHLGDSLITNFVGYNVSMPNVSMTLTDLPIEGEWTVEQATMDNSTFEEAVREAVESEISDTSLYVDSVISMNPFGPRIRINEDA